MAEYTVSATGLEPVQVQAESWLGALGSALQTLGLLDALQGLACEVMPNGTVIARDVKSGRGFVVTNGVQVGAQPAEREEVFTIANLPRSVFHANLAHELRAPLNLIVGYSEMLIEESVDLKRQELAADLRKMKTASSELLELLEAGLEAARVEAGNLPIRLERFGMSDFIDEVEAAFAGEALARGNDLRVSGPSQAVEIEADPLHVRTLLLRLFRRANVQLQRGEIHLDVEATPDALTFLISDSGPAPAASELDELFRVFARTTERPATTAATLRLATSKRLLERMGGTVSLRTVRGHLEVSVHLPIAEVRPL